MADDVIEFTEKEKSYEIVMYSGVLNKIIDSIGGASEIDKFWLNTESCDKVIKTMLSSYDDKGNVIGEIYPSFKLSNSNREKLLTWGFEHITDFLLNTGEKIAEKMAKVQSKTKNLMKGSNVSNNG